MYSSFRIQFLLALLLGLFFGTIFSDIYLFIYISIFFGTVYLLSPFYLSKKFFLYFFVFFVGAGLYGIFAAKHIEIKYNFFRKYENQYYEYTGEVIARYKRKEYADSYIVRLEKMNSDVVPYSVEYLVDLPKNFSLIPGDIIRHTGKFQYFKDFDHVRYKNYMLSQKLYFSVHSLSPQKIGVSPGFFSEKKREIFFLREKFLEKIFTLYPKEEALFLAGILIGARENMPKDLSQDFNNSGLTHFIAVSGFNITLCILFFGTLFSFFPKWIRIMSVMGLLALFCIFVGLGAPVLRAFIMGVIGYILLAEGKQGENFVILLFTALCMAFWNPYSLLYDVSFHLSFGAVLGILFTQPHFKKIFFFLPEFLAIREAAVLTCSALVFCLPLMMFEFGQVSLFAPIANIAVTWTIPIAMLFGALSLIFDFISQNLAQYFSFFPWMLLSYDIDVVRFFGNLSFSVLHIKITEYALYYKCLYYICVIYILFLLDLKKKKPF